MIGHEAGYMAEDVTMYPMWKYRVHTRTYWCVVKAGNEMSFLHTSHTNTCPINDMISILHADKHLNLATLFYITHKASL